MELPPPTFLYVFMKQIPSLGAVKGTPYKYLFVQSKVIPPFCEGGNYHLRKLVNVRLEQYCRTQAHLVKYLRNGHYVMALTAHQT